MILNGECTIYRLNDSEEYAEIARYPCMCQGSSAYDVKKYGEEWAGSAVIFIPLTDVDIKIGDKITADSDKIERSVMSVSAMNYGSPELQHTEVTAI